MTEKKLHLIGRIDQVIRDYFEKNKSVKQLQAKDLMVVFIDKGIFKKDYREGLPIRKLLRELDAEKKLHLISNVKVIRNDINRNWLFVRR